MKTRFIIGFFVLLCQSVVGQPVANQLVATSRKKPPCYFRETAIRYKPLQDTITKYLKRIKPFELPIMAVVRKGDSTEIYLSAVIAANSIRNSPPSYLTRVGNREVAVYTGGESVMGLDSVCLSQLVGYCRQFLQIDAINTKEGKKPGTKQFYLYDPVWVKITQYKNEIVSVNDRGQPIRSVPFFEFSF